MRHGPAVCCEESMNEEWSYCPSCGEAIDWPQDPKEVAEREAAHRLRMETDPHYRKQQEATRQLLAQMHVQMLEQFCRPSDPILHPEAP